MLKNKKPITTDYGTTNDNEENTLSLVVKQKLVKFVLKLLKH